MAVQLLWDGGLQICVSFCEKLLLAPTVCHNHERFWETSKLFTFAVVPSFKEFEYHTYGLSIIFATHVVFQKSILQVCYSVSPTIQVYWSRLRLSFLLLALCVIYTQSPSLYHSDNSPICFWSHDALILIQWWSRFQMLCLRMIYSFQMKPSQAQF